MYIVKRRINESVAIGAHVVVQILSINSGTGDITLGLVAPKSAPIKKIPTLTELPRLDDEVETRDELEEAERQVD